MTPTAETLLLTLQRRSPERTRTVHLADRVHIGKRAVRRYMRELFVKGYAERRCRVFDKGAETWKITDEGYEAALELHRDAIRDLRQFAGA